MKLLTYYTGLILSILVFQFSFSQTTIEGKVTDQNNQPLFGANIVIQNTYSGTTTDEEGNFTLQTSTALPLTLEVSYIGFGTQSIKVENDESLLIQMVEGTYFDEVIVSASRRAEKLQEAPAAVSVITKKNINASGGSVSPIRALINSPGVELQQQTGQRINIALRGSSGVFSTNVFPMLDYRSLISPGLEYFDSQNSPINNIDLERIEVVLGPTSALYGPDVTTGVVHFISKNPFDHPGSTAELIYGERNTFKVALRHAGKNNEETFAYKFNLRYGSGNDFTLDPNDVNDQRILSSFATQLNRAQIHPEGYVDTDSPGIPLRSLEQKQIPDYWAAAANTSLHFRPITDMEIVAAGGWNAGSALFYNDLGEGQVFSNEYWGQVRFNYKGWFAQTYYIKNDGGNDDNPTYLNRTGIIVPLERSHFETQVQYNFNWETLFNSDWTLGFDYRNAISDTQNHVYGRHENEDDYNLYGGYAQAKFRLDPKLDFLLAGRYDGYNFTDEKTFSPRAAFVYKPNLKHNLRLTYNKAANPIPASDIYFDLPVQSIDDLNLDIWVLGAKNPYTYGSNPVINWFIPGVPNTPLSAGFPLSAAFLAVNDLVQNGLDAYQNDPQIGPLLPLLKNVLDNSIPNGFAPVVSTDVDGEPLEAKDRVGNYISFLNVYEFGYKGLFGDRFAAGFDVYHIRRKGGAGFQQINPVVNFTNLGTQLGSAVQAEAQPQIVQGLIAQGFDENTATAFASLVGQEINKAYTQGGDAFTQQLENAGLPFHGLVPLENEPQSSALKLISGYYNTDPDRVSSDWGFEIHSKYFISDDFSAFANYTWFNNKDGEPGDLNFPQNKVRLGLSYQPEKKFNGRINYQWDQAYTSTQSNYPGEIDAKSLFDVTLGYALSKNLDFELSAINLFNNEFSALPGFPKIGRTVTGRLVFDIE